MKVERLSLRNFRNFEACRIEPSEGLNFLLGGNGQGKTSVLEAIHLLGTLRSFRGSDSAEMLRWGASRAEIDCVVSPRADEASEAWRTDLKFSLERPQDGPRVIKTAEINGKPYRSASHYLKQRFGQVELGFHSVVFNPSDHDLVRGSPSERRAYLDRVLGAERLDYFQALQAYGKTLEQRNAALKDFAFDPALLHGFTEPLIRTGAQIVHMRLEWIHQAQAAFTAHARQIAPNQSITRVFYLSNWVPKIEGLSFPIQDLDNKQFTGHSPVPSLELLEIEFRKALAQVAKAEQKAQHSLVGPHRDDWDIALGDRSIRGHGSQGEVRSSLLALKMTEIERFRKTTGHRPLFLLDDFSSELDQSRRGFLLHFLAETDLQVFVTTTEGSIELGRRFWVSQGNVLESPPA